MSKESDQLISKDGDASGSLCKRIISPCLAEFLAVFLFTYVGCSSVLDPLGEPESKRSASGVAVAHGFTRALLTVAFIKISGAHFNPVITLAVFLSGGITFVLALCYVAAQILGSLVGAAFVRITMSTDLYMQINGGATELTSSNALEGIVCEAVLTLLLVITFLLSVLDEHTQSPIAPIAIGFAETACILAGIGISGAAMNPVRSLGPAVSVSVYHPAVWTHHYVYWVGPIAGSLVAVVFYRLAFAGPQNRVFFNE